MRFIGCVAFAIALTAPAIRADITVHLHSDSKLVPAAAADRTVRLKGNRARFVIGNLPALADFGKQELTVLDPARKAYATIPLSQFRVRIKAAMPQMQAALAQMVDPAQIKTATTASRRTATIQGMTAQEGDLTITVTITIPGGDPSSKARMKLAVRIWIAAPAEFLHKPALKDLTTFNQWQRYFLDIAGAFPGWHSAFEEMIRSGGVVLRTHTEIRMDVPGIAAADAAPVMTANEEVSQIASDPIDESLFRIPPDFAPAPFEDLVKGTPETQTGQVPAGGAPLPRPDGVKTYVPEWTPIEDTEPVYPEIARARNLRGVVNLLVTIDPKGRVIHAEVLSGPAVFRPAAIAAVMQWKYRPVMRGGAPVTALTNADVEFRPERPGDAPEQDVAGAMAVANRRMQLEKELPRSPQEILEDLEQDMDGGDDERQFYMLDEVTKAAAHAGAFDKAARYAEELLSEAAKNADDPNYGNALYDGNAALGRVALRQGDIRKAGSLLLEAGRTPGSVQLDNLGPDMTLALELLEKGQRDVVLQYFDLCRRFWRSGSQQLDAWNKTVREGGIPKFGANLR